MGFAASRLGTALLVWLPGGALYFAVILYSAAVMVNFLGCGWFFVARAEHFEGTWLSRVGARPLFVDSHVHFQMLRAIKAAGYFCRVRKAIACLPANVGTVYSEAALHQNVLPPKQAKYQLTHLGFAFAGNEDLSHAPPGQQYLAALYFTITTLSTTGYGDVVAQNSLEQVRSCPNRIQPSAKPSSLSRVQCQVMSSPQKLELAIVGKYAGQVRMQAPAISPRQPKISMQGAARRQWPCSICSWASARSL